MYLLHRLPLLLCSSFLILPSTSPFLSQLLVFTSLSSSYHIHLPLLLCHPHFMLIHPFFLFKWFHSTWTVDRFSASTSSFRHVFCMQLHSSLWRRCGSILHFCWSYWPCRVQAPKPLPHSICVALIWSTPFTLSVGREVFSTCPGRMTTLCCVRLATAKHLQNTKQYHRDALYFISIQSQQCGDIWGFPSKCFIYVFIYLFILQL